MNLENVCIYFHFQSLQMLLKSCYKICKSYSVVHPVNLRFPLTRTLFCSTPSWKKSDIHLFKEFPIKKDTKLNPLAQLKVSKSRSDNHDDSAKALRVSVIGTTNSGKSTLINKLTGHHVCPESMKANTTRSNARAIITEGDTQIVFVDTPGVTDLETATKFKLEKSLLNDPEESCMEADLLLVLHDVSNRFVREAINKKVLRLLFLYYRNVPSILVLNKMDTIPRSRRMYDLIRKLTCNRLDGVQGEVNITKDTESRKSTEAYLKKKSKKIEEVKDASFDRINKIIETSKSSHVSESDVHELTSELIGWPGFRDVFTISALKGDGVNDLRNYLMASAKPGFWPYSKQMRFDSDPRDIVINIIKSKFLEHLPNAIPYGLQPEISMWEMDENWNRLNILATVDAKNKNIYRVLLGPKGSRIQRMGRDTQEALINFFSHEVYFKLSVVPKFDLKEAERAKSSNKAPTTLKPNIQLP